MDPQILCVMPTCVWENTAILQAIRRRSKPVAGGDESAQFIGAGLVQYPETGAHDRGLVRSFGNSVRAPGRGAAIPLEAYDPPCLPCLVRYARKPDTKPFY